MTMQKLVAVSEQGLIVEFEYEPSQQALTDMLKWQGGDMQRQERFGWNRRTDKSKTDSLNNKNSFIIIFVARETVAITIMNLTGTT